jgi:hypothetical protein
MRLIIKVYKAFDKYHIFFDHVDETLRGAGCLYSETHNRDIYRIQSQVEPAIDSRTLYIPGSNRSRDNIVLTTQYINFGIDFIKRGLAHINGKENKISESYLICKQLI